MGVALGLLDLHEELCHEYCLSQTEELCCSGQVGVVAEE